MSYRNRYLVLQLGCTSYRFPIWSTKVETDTHIPNLNSKAMPNSLSSLLPPPSKTSHTSQTSKTSQTSQTSQIFKTSQTPKIPKTKPTREERSEAEAATAIQVAALNFVCRRKCDRRNRAATTIQWGAYAHLVRRWVRLSRLVSETRLRS